jgi:alkylated DNA nucleotide flippase Atl1
MANESKKDFNAMLNNSKDMPTIKDIDKEEVVKRYGGSRMLLAPPIDYDGLMRQVPKGKVVTSEQIRKVLANRYGADFTCPLTAGIFINIAAWASEQRDTDKTPYWRTLKSDGELNEKYPGGIDAQQKKLEAEGFTIFTKGRSKQRYYVQDFDKALAKLR